MKHFANILLFLCLISCGGPKGNWEDSRVILVSIDGLRGDILEDPELEIKYPNLFRLMELGESCGNVQTVFPSLTYPSHTSMITGVMPDKHGIVNNRPFIPENNFVDWYWYADSIKVPTLITQAKKKGLISLGVSWPVSVGAEMDWMLPEIKSVSDTISTVDLVRKHDRPETFLESAKVRGVVPEDGNPTGFGRDLLLHEVFMDAFHRKAPHLSLYHMIETDLVQHEFGKGSDESIHAFMFMDSLLGNIIALLDEMNLWESTTLIVTGDHGFRNYEKQINLNKLFLDNGWLAIKDGSISSDWKVVCMGSGGSAFVRLKNPLDKEFKKKVRLLLSKQDGFEILEQRHMNGTLWAPLKTDFLLMAKNKFGFVRSLDQPFILEKSGGSHGGDPRRKILKTGYIAAGRNVQKRTIESMSITDIAFKISDLLDLDLKN
ncbi:MAG: alkaline phosphatase family protein [Candidatus Marinimicrobia bacterium]|jgi:predicted AlkP superfamily pyrophosphatase or phosphodiesterase|nr:alkaline phosphatase family protein [Candidatus Neomarinimicrobiota bacterium]MBT3840055.1 alkaline phosphatase family protein [Candidatus Neomarinimicrobiota bacterium]MBT4282114.1 alkaline phosphatase family protein [Candidatus Neomarinimicrobiota bacterium]MBT4578853.1 alkaline phosphatase family protein [Candidatus Neomarinimicrobiota bacterium]MBT4956379.1 alkaline phosphatase family protein [Candidatus Neomarinimicrobiota bacterium]